VLFNGRLRETSPLPTPGAPLEQVIKPQTGRAHEFMLD